MEVVADKPVRSGRKAKGAGYLRRAEILHAAEKLFVREGYQGATIRKIAQEVGLSSTALYMHFKDKSEILLEICESTFAHLSETNLEVAAQPLSAEQRVRQMLAAYIEFGLANPNAYLVVFERTLASPDKAAQLNELGQQCAQPLKTALTELSAATPLRCNADIATHIAWAACHGLITSLINHPMLEWPAARQEMIDTMLDTVIFGLKRP